MSKQASVDYRPITISPGHPMLGTPVDPRTNIGRYLNDVSRMMGEEGYRWRHRIFLPPVTSPMLHESPDHRTMTMGGRPKWRKNTLLPNPKTMWLVYNRCGTTPGFGFFKQYFTLMLCTCAAGVVVSCKIPILATRVRFPGGALLLSLDDFFLFCFLN